MKKYNVMGHEMAKMEDVKWCVRKARKDIDLFGRDKSDEANDFAKFILELVIRSMFIDEIRAAKSDEEKENILEMTGDFIVAKCEGKGQDRTIRYFGQFDNGKAVIERMPYKAMHFDYESMAKHVAEQLGEDWHAVDLNPQETEHAQRFLDAIFEDKDDE